MRQAALELNACPAGQMRSGAWRWVVPMAVGLWLAVATAPAAIRNVTAYGATGGDATDDTVAIQNAVNASVQGDTVYFPAGTYFVSMVYIKYGRTYCGETGANGSRLAVVKRLPNQSKWVRSFTTQNDLYSGTADSPLLDIHDLIFDGNRTNQGPYLNYELEQQALVFLMAGTTGPGRLKSHVYRCDFNESAGDGIHIYNNVDAEVSDCTASNCFRGGVTQTGGYSKLTLTNYIAGGTVHKFGINVEVDAGGYGGSCRIDDNLTNLTMAGVFDVATLGGGSVIAGDNITCDINFHLYAPDSTINITNSTFGMDSSLAQLIYYPCAVTFTNCNFIAKKLPGDTGTVFKPISVIWGDYDNETLTFDNCRWTLGSGINPSTDTCYAIYTTAVDGATKNNEVILTNGSSIAAGYRYGVFVSQGGRPTIRKTTIGADTAVWLGSSSGYYLKATLDEVYFANTVVTSEYISTYDSLNTITHRNMVVDRAQNVLGTNYGLAGNTYSGGRKIIGTVAPGANTPGFAGDLYQLDPIPATGQIYQWQCRATSPAAAAWQAVETVPTPDPTLLAHWQFDEAAGSAIARDSSGNGGPDGTLINGPTRVVGPLWRGLTLDGVDDYVTIGGNEDRFDFAAGDNFTLSAWVRWDGTSQLYQPVIQKGNLNGNNYYFLGLSTGGEIRFMLKDGTNVSCEVTGGYAPVDTWIHVAGVKSSHYVRLYVNGVQVASVPHAFTSGFTSTYPLRLGFLSYLTPPGDVNYGLHGAVDDVRVYRRALSAEEVRALCPDIEPTPDPALLAHWRFDEGAGSTTIRDSSGNGGPDGLLTNGPVWVTGHQGAAVALDGYNDYVAIGGDENRFDFAAGDNFTLSAWVKWDGTSQMWQPIIQKGDLNAVNHYYLGMMYNGVVYFRLRDGNGNYAEISGGSAPVDAWIHVVGVKDPQCIRVYVNGVQAASLPNAFTSGFSSTYPLRLGFLSYLTPPSYVNYGLHGAVDDVRVYRRALSTAEVQAQYNEGSCATSGTVELQDFSGNVTLVPVTLEIRDADNAALLETHVVNLDAAGRYSFTTFLLGARDVTARAEHWLRQKQSNVNLTGTAIVNFNLTNGDGNGDNQVTGADLSIVLSVMDCRNGDSNWNPQADLDGDGGVTSTDLSISLANMGVLGDP